MGTESQFRRLAGASRGKKASPPIFSQEFFIQNHGDIFSCIVMFVFAAFMFQVTSPIANVLAMPQYNNTAEGRYTMNGVPAIPPRESEHWTYTNGPKDVFTVLFYVIVCITAHAIVQEYGVDKLQRRLHLSKTKTSKFGESGHLFVFSLYSMCHAGYLLERGGYLAEVTKLWAGYPDQHRFMNAYTKMFFIIQISYWLHQFPEFFLQRVKRDEIRSRAIYTIVYLLCISVAYIFNFNRVAMYILCLHYAAEAVFHACRMAHFAEKNWISRPGFKLWNFMFVLVRLGCVTLAVLTFWYGLRAFETPFINPAAGNYNTAFIRLNCMLCVIGVQVWMMWNFIMFHLRRYREASVASARPKQLQQQRAKQRKAAKRLEEEVRNLPEADQDTTRVLRSAKKQN